MTASHPARPARKAHDLAEVMRGFGWALAAMLRIRPATTHATSPPLPRAASGLTHP